MRIILSRFDENGLHAGPKAKRDVEKILREGYGFRTISFPDNETKFKKILRSFSRIFGIFVKTRMAEITVVEWPYSARTIFTRVIKKPIVIIHDIEGLRYGDEAAEERELAFLRGAEKIISHNAKMTQYLVEHGVAAEKITNLELFDYLVPGEGEIPERKLLVSGRADLTRETSVGASSERGSSGRKAGATLRVAFPGNLEKSEFLKELDEAKMQFEMNLYGAEWKGEQNAKMHYMGSLQPDEVPVKIEGDLGLVWDGKADESDADVGLKNYTRYNNPHKLSCYVAANMPVVVWEKAAVADFVKKNDIGYTIRELYDINKLDLSDYDTKARNVTELGKKVRGGWFTKRAMSEILGGQKQ